MTSGGPWFTVVLIGSDDFRARAVPMVQERESLLVTGSVGAGEAVATAVGRAPDVVVVGDPPGAGGASAAALAREIGAALPGSRILAVAHDAPGTEPDELIDAWVGGVVEMGGSTDLADAVEWLALGEGLLDRGLAAAVLARHHRGASPVPLTATEQEVVQRLAAGATADSLAAEHAVTPRLVRLHAGGALARLHPTV